MAESSVPEQQVQNISLRVTELQQKLAGQLQREKVNIGALQAMMPKIVNEMHTLHETGSKKGDEGAQDTNAVRVAAHDMAIAIHAWLARTSEAASGKDTEQPGAARQLLSEMAVQLLGIYRTESTTFPETAFLNFPFTDVNKMLGAAGHALEFAQSGGYDRLDHDRRKQFAGRLDAMMDALHAKAADKGSDVQEQVKRVLNTILLQGSMNKN